MQVSEAFTARRGVELESGVGEPEATLRLQGSCVPRDQPGPC